MAYLRLGNIKEHTGSGGKAKGLQNCIDYILNPSKTKNQSYVGAYNFNVATENKGKHAFETMLSTKRMFSKEDGRQGYHFKLSFAENDQVTPELAMKITNDFCESVFKDYECLYAVHDNTNHLHSHIVINSIDIVEGKKYHYDKGDWGRTIQPKVNEICKKYGLSEIDLSMDEKFRLSHKCKVYSQWEIKEYRKKQEVFFSNKMIQSDVDECISKASSYDEFKKLLSVKGHVVDDSGKYIKLLAPGRERYCRLYSLTPDKQTYTKENIERMIAGTYLSREDIQDKLFREWNQYSVNRKRPSVTRIKVELAKSLEEQELIIVKKLATVVAVDDYMEYLRRADVELNIIRKRVKDSMEQRKDVLADMDQLIGLMKHYARYKAGDMRFEPEYIKVNELYRKITGQGYNLTELYRYKATGEMLLSSVELYKKRIYVERKVCERIKQKSQEQPVTTRIQENGIIK